MTDTTERAELLALADRLAVFTKLSPHDFFEQSLSGSQLQLIVTALRRLAAQDQKPVAWHSPTDSVTPFVKPHIKEAMLPHAAAQYSVPLYLSPPPASIPTCCVTGAIPGDGGACGDCDPCIMGEPLVPEAVKRLIAEKNSLIERNAELEEAANASAEARLREALEVSGDAIDEYYRYWTGGESRGSYDGRPERANLWKAMYAVRAALKAISAHPNASEDDDCCGAVPPCDGCSPQHPHTSDCAQCRSQPADRLFLDETRNFHICGDCWTKNRDAEIRAHASDCEKQECMGDASPCDPKDLQELLNSPSVLEPSDRTADVTVEQAAHKCADDLVLIVEAATKMAHRTGNTFVIDRARVASMIAGHFNAFTVGRR